MTTFHQQFSAFIAEFKAQRGLGNPQPLRSPNRPRHVLSATEVDAARRELDELLPQYDPSYEDDADGDRYESGKRVADRISFLCWFLSAA
jgi:hypothetical protein